jgi:hypothetical protein
MAGLHSAHASAPFSSGMACGLPLPELCFGDDPLASAMSVLYWSARPRVGAAGKPLSTVFVPISLQAWIFVLKNVLMNLNKTR